MSDHIPFEIQSEIMKRLPVNSLLQFRSVSKQWKSFIDSPEFIKTYHINHPNPHHHLLVQRMSDAIRTYTSIIDDNTFPKQKFSVTAPEPLNLLRNAVTLSSANGLLCFYGDVYSKTEMAVIWNPSVRKYVGIVIPNVLSSIWVGYTRIGFGVCSDTNDPKLVKINIVTTPSKCWEVQVFALSSRVWKTVYMGAPKSVGLKWNQVSVDGVIYWHSYDNIIISFDLKNEKFGEVCLPERLVSIVEVVKVHESLGLIEYYDEGDMPVCGVWMRKDGVNKPFTKIYTIKFEGTSFNRVLGFRNNGEVVMEMDDDDLSGKSHIEVYEPLSGRFNNVGISGKHRQFIVSSYMETLLLVDQSNSIIH